MDNALAFALFAAATSHVEREEAGFVVALFGQRLCRKQVTNVVIGFDVSDRIGARRAPYGCLVHQHHFVHLCHVGVNTGEATRLGARLIEQPQHTQIKDIVHQRALTGTAHAGNGREALQGDFNIDIFEVVGLGAHNLNIVPPTSPADRHRDGSAHFGWITAHHASQIVGGKVVLLLHQLAKCAAKHHFATELSGSRANINHIVGGADNGLVVFHDHHGVAYVTQAFQHANEILRITGVEADTRFIQYIDRADQAAAQ